MRALVTGGAGFIGSHLVERLVERGDAVTVVDNFCSSRRENLARIDGSDAVEIIEADVLSDPRIENDIDYVLHLASRASPRDYQENPLHTLRTNVEGTLNMLEVAAAHDAAFMFASTSEVYGDPTVHPQPEDYWGHVNPVGPRACYDEGKRAGEAAIVSFIDERGIDLDYRIARIFNTYGPRMRPDDGRVVSNFVTQALAGDPITVYGDGTQTRSFCYVTDTVDALVDLMDAGSGEIFNVGNPEEVEIGALAEVVKEVAQSDADIVHQKLPEDDPERRRPDISKIQDRIDWEPSVGLREGIERTAQYFREIGI